MKDTIIVVMIAAAVSFFATDVIAHDTQDLIGSMPLVPGDEGFIAGTPIEEKDLPDFILNRSDMGPFEFRTDEGNIIVSVASSHTGTFDYDNNNFGIGYEDNVSGNTWIGFVNYNNSYSKQSTMIFVSQKFGPFGASLGIADNYEDDANSFDNGFLLIPLVSATAKVTDSLGIRLSTSAPFSAALGGDTVTNVSLIIKN